MNGFVRELELKNDDIAEDDINTSDMALRQQKKQLENAGYYS